MVKPRVSFIMPAFNAGPFITEAIESIQRQSVKEWELIIIDDGSTDDTLSIAKAYALRDSRIRVLEMDKPSGSAFQPRKLGIENALAPIIAPLDADDFIEDTYLEKLLNLKEKTKAQIIYPCLYLYDDNETTYFQPKDVNLIGRRIKGRDCVVNTLFEWKIGCGGGIIDKNLYQIAFNEFDSDLNYSTADELLTRQLMVLAPWIAVSDAKYFYRQNPLSITRKVSLKQFDFIVNNHNLLEFIKNHFPKKSQEYILIQRQLLYGIISGIKNIDRNDLSVAVKQEISRNLKFAKSDLDYSVILKTDWKYTLLALVPLFFARNILKLRK